MAWFCFTALCRTHKPHRQVIPKSRGHMTFIIRQVCSHQPALEGRHPSSVQGQYGILSQWSGPWLQGLGGPARGQKTIREPLTRGQLGFQHIWEDRMESGHASLRAFCSPRVCLWLIGWHSNTQGENRQKGRDPSNWGLGKGEMYYTEPKLASLSPQGPSDSAPEHTAHFCSAPEYKDLLQVTP